MEKAKPSKKRLGYGWFIAAIIFLINPCINVVDVLPDFFGYLFLLCGLNKWADLCLKMRFATEGLSKLRIAMLIKMLSVLMIPFVDENWVLILTFGFTVIEFIYLLPAIGKIFDGMDYFATRFDGESPTVNIKNVCAITYIFFISKAALTLIPELCSLSDFEYSGYVTSGVQTNFADFRNLFILINLLFSILLGILWLVNIIPYINRIADDKPFLDRILSAYDSEIAGNEAIAIRRNFKKATVFIITALAFIPKLAFDEFNIIPNFMVGIFIVIACVYLKRLGKITKLLPITACISILAGIASYTLSIVFEVTHGIDIVRFRPDAFEAIELYNITRLVSLIDYAVMLLCIILLFVGLRRIALALLTPKATTDSRMLALEEAQTKSNKRQIILGLILATVIILLNAAYTMVRAIVPPEVWLIPFFISIVFVVCTANILYSLYEKVEYKYL